MQIDESKMFNSDELGFPSLDETPTQEVEVKQEVPEEPAKPVEEKPAEPVESVKEEPETKAEEKEIKISNPPVQYEGESDIQFSLRTQLYNAGQAKAQAVTEEEKSVLTQHMKTLRKEMAKASSSPKEEAETKVQPTEEGTSDSEEEAAKIALKKLGIPDKDEVMKLVQEIVKSQQAEIDHSSAIKEFYSSRKDIASDPAKMKMLEDVVIQKFNVTPQTSKQDLIVAMDMAASYLFPKQNKSAAVNTAADKRELLNFSSNTQTVKTVSREDEKTAAGLKEVGMSMKDMGWED